MKTKTILSIILVIAILALAGYLTFKKEIGSVNIPKTDDQSSTVQNGNMVAGLTVPSGFKITYFAKDIPGARTIEFDPRGRMLVAQTDEGSISVLEDADGNGVAEKKAILVDGLSKPHGLAWKCENNATICSLYVAENNALTRFTYDVATSTVSQKTKLADLDASATDRHFTRSLLFLPAPNENTLLISVGSSCNVCNEKNEQHAKILAYDVPTKKITEYAKGLRNAVFMTLNPVNGKVFATEMGRDGLGDTTPPDEINIIEKDKNYGWPICYGKNIHDTDFDKNVYIRNPCMSPFETESFVDLHAHSAPLGLSFIPEEGWPEEYWYNLLVAFHGSWNSSVPTGYKIVRLKMDSKGTYSGTEDFITGWLTVSGEKIGRPADIKAQPGGTLYISDDMIGAIYKVSKM